MTNEHYVISTCDCCLHCNCGAEYGDSVGLANHLEENTPTVIEKHRLVHTYPEHLCSCGWACASFGDWARHATQQKSPGGCVSRTTEVYSGPYPHVNPRANEFVHDREEDDTLVNRPAHYNQGKIEVITAIEDWKLPYHLANVVKYIARAPYKGEEMRDLAKASWYLNRYIKLLREQQ